MYKRIMNMAFVFVCFMSKLVAHRIQFQTGLDINSYVFEVGCMFN